MAELIALGPKSGESWRRVLPVEQTVVLGRAAGEFSVPWDSWLSRQHAELNWRRGGFLQVQRAQAATNPIFFAGEPNDRFEVTPGGHFVIGRTTFIVETADTNATTDEPELVQARTVGVPDLERLPFQDAAHQLDVLSRLPEVIAGAANDHELHKRLTGMLLAGIRRAEVVALIDAAKADEIEVLHWESRQAGVFRPSQRLVREVVHGRHQAVLHLWGNPTENEPAFTVSAQFDWAFCTPVPDEACVGWCIYATGKFAQTSAASVLGPLENNALRDDLKFTGLVAAILGALRQTHALERRQTSLASFFSPPVRQALAAANPEEALRPREADISVLFCDLRGFSRQSEQQGGALMALLERVSKALRVMTQNILDQGGVIADFQGDAAMGFWGWPLPQPDMAVRTASAALVIRSVFEAAAAQPRHALAGFQVGIGIATGQAVAGKIGTVDQAKVGVFGPVVNLASRLEGMTKILPPPPILIDEATAKLLRAGLPTTVGRCRRLAVVRPIGLEQALTVSELLPAQAEFPLLTDVHLARYEEALDAFEEGDWAKAYERLHEVPPQDRCKDFLLGRILMHNHVPPPNWDGVVSLDRKE